MMSNLGLHEYWKLVWHVINHVAVGKEDNGAVGGEEDEDMPDSMEVREANRSPVGTEEPIIDPGNQGHGDDADTPFTKVEDLRVPLVLKHHHHQANAGDSQQHQTESVHSLLREMSVWWWVGGMELSSLQFLGPSQDNIEYYIAGIAWPGQLVLSLY